MTTLDKLADIEVTFEGWAGDEPWVTYRVRGAWSIDIVGNKYSGIPTGLTVRHYRDNGVGTEHLRNVPMSDARKRLRGMVEERKRTHYGPEDFPMAKRMRTTEDWKQFAAAYEKARGISPTRPVAFLAEVTGISYNTLAARVSGAKFDGYIRKRDGDNWDVRGGLRVVS